MAYNYIVTAHKPTIITHSLVGRFTGPEDLNLILCKSNRIEIHGISSEGLQLILDVGIYGKIATASLFRNKGENQDSLFISTEKFQFCVLYYDAIKGEIISRSNGDIHEDTGRPADIGQIGIIDPDCRMIGLHIYDGNFKVIPINENGQLQESYNLKTEELQVIDIKFLYGCARPTIAVLYQDTKEARHVKTYEITKDLIEGPWNSNVENAAEFLINLPKPFGGVLIVGEQSIDYQNGITYCSLAMKSTIMKAYGLIDPNGSRILLGDYLGRIYCLILLHEGDKVTGLQLELLGETSCPSTISYLDNGFVFIGSTCGDSQLIKLETEKNPETGQFITIIENFTNLGPIVDMCVVDMERQGQGQIVTCSGSYKDGSLRIVRNGVGINQYAQIDLPGIKGIWSLNPPEGSNVEKYLVVSFVGETRILAMAGEQLEETEIQGFYLDQQTIFCSNVTHEQYLQVTSKGIFLLDSVSEKRVSNWLAPVESKINVCSANFYQIAVATKGRDLTILEIGNKEIKQISTRAMPYDIACISIDPIGPSVPKASMCVVGLWTDISVRILALPNLEDIRKVEIGGETIPRSLMLKTFDDISYLFIALGDGHLISYTYDLISGDLENKKKITIGTRPVTLNQFKSRDCNQVFACSDRPVVIHHSSTKKLLYANINLKEVNYMCDFDCSSFPSALALATEDSLTIGSLDEIQQLHIRTIPLGEMPRRICHQESTRCFCLLTVKTEFDEKAEEIETGWIKLIDDQTFEVKDNFVLEPYENPCSVLSTKFNNDDSEYFVVGTTFAHPNDHEPNLGRLLVFSVKDDKLRLQTEFPVKGAVYSMVTFRGKILTGINSKVQLYKWQEQEGGKQLSMECEHKGHILALYLASRGDFIIVGDVMKSISLLLYNETERTIKELARDYNSNWMVAVSMLDDDNYIGAENNYNIFTVSKNSGAVTQEDRVRLEVNGKFHAGESINQFRHGSLVMKLSEDEGPQFGVTLLYGGISGTIGVIATLDPKTYEFLEQVQNCLNDVLKGIGGFSHAEWRQFSVEKKTSPSKGFIDGDLVENFLELPPLLQSIVSTKMKVSVEELTKRIETIARALH